MLRRELPLNQTLFTFTYTKAGERDPDSNEEMQEHVSITVTNETGECFWYGTVREFKTLVKQLLLFDEACTREV